MDKEYLYEDRYVAFIDILGFRELLKYDKASNIKNILEVFYREHEENYNKNKSNKSSIGVEISLFSDSLISYPVKDDKVKLLWGMCQEFGGKM